MPTAFSRMPGTPHFRHELHYTGMPTADGALDWLSRAESQVSSHYFVHENGEVVQLV
ncbi:N-acetylmuramoyl-L-alanine amidase, partial [Rhizobium leguminosarum]|uniref:N-acetylmuramoyl-L-alanine amidase n=1 Tax=Rhizobium leguminosarum TaxID=384 RepID=UPI003F9C930B